MKQYKVDRVSIVLILSIAVLCGLRWYSALINNIWSINFVDQVLETKDLTDLVYDYPENHLRGPVWYANAAILFEDILIAQESVLNLIITLAPDNKMPVDLVPGEFTQYDTPFQYSEISRILASNCIQRGDFERLNENYQLAGEWYKLAIFVNYTWGDPWYYLGWMNIKLSEYDNALIAFRNGFNLSLINIGKSDFLYQIGWLQSQGDVQSELKTAKDSLTSAIDKNLFTREHLEISAHYLRGRVSHRLGHYQEAILDYEWVIKNKPNKYFAYIYLADILWMDKPDYPLIIKLYSTAISIDGDRSQALIGLANVFYEIGRISDSIELLKKVIELDPQNEVVLRRLDQIQNLNGK